MDDFAKGDAHVSEDLTEIGQWLEFLCYLLGTNPTQLGRRSGVGRATISELMHPKDGRRVRPEPETIEKLWTTIQQLASERIGHSFSDEFGEAFWNAADHVSSSQRERAQARLLELRLMVALLKEKDRHIADLRRENNALKRQQRRR